MDNQPAEGKKKFKPGGCSLADVKKKRQRVGRGLSWLQEKKTRGEKIKPARGRGTAGLIGLGLGCFPFLFFVFFLSKLPPCASVENSYL
jgi:hypothetical protein